jgi:hypothetical protein
MVTVNEKMLVMAAAAAGSFVDCMDNNNIGEVERAGCWKSSRSDLGEREVYFSTPVPLILISLVSVHQLFTLLLLAAAAALISTTTAPSTALSCTFSRLFCASCRCATASFQLVLQTSPLSPRSSRLCGLGLSHTAG